MKGSTKTYSGIITVALLLAFVVSVYSQSSGLPQDGLVNHWKFDGDAKDSVGSIDGVVTGASLKPGLFDQAYSFDGDKDYINLGNYTTAEERVYSVSMWFKTDHATRQDIFNRGRSGNCYHNPSAHIVDGRIIVSESTCNGNGRIGGKYYPGIPVNLGEWNHVVVTRDTDTTKLYLNGYLQVVDKTVPVAPVNDYSRITIGAMFNTNKTGYSNSFNGLIDDVAVWNRALSEVEVENIYKQVYTNAKPPPKLGVEYQNIETFLTNKSVFTDAYTGNSGWTVQQGSWVVENNILKNVDGPTEIGGDIITLNSYESSPGKSIKAKLRQASGGSKSRYSKIYIGYQDKNNTYYISLDTLYKTLYIRRSVAGVEDSIGLEVDVVKDVWYDVEVRWISPTEIQVEIWDESGKSLGVLTRDSMFDWTTSKSWATGKFGFGGVRGGKRVWFDDVRIGTIKGVISPSPTSSPTPTQSPLPSPTPSPTTSPGPSPTTTTTPSPTQTATPSPTTTTSPSPSPPVGNDFDLSITGDTEINEGENAKFTVGGAPNGEEETTVYFFNFDVTKNGLPTESKYDDVRQTFNRPFSIRSLYVTAGTYTIGVLGVGGLASDNPSGNKATAQHTIAVKDIPPKANAGKDITINQNAKVPFNGGGSYAGDFDETFFYWDVDASDELSFDPERNNSDLKGIAPQTPPNSYSYPNPGVYTVTLRVFDDDGTHADDTVKVTVLEVNQLPSPTSSPSPTPTPPPEVSQLKLPLKNNNLDAITKLTLLDANFLLSVVDSIYQDLDNQDKKFLISLPFEIVKRGIQLDAGVEDKLAEVLSKAFGKETDEKTQVDIVEAIGLIKSQKTIDFISVILTNRLLGNCVSELVCSKAEQVALNIGHPDLLQLLDLINFVSETSQTEVFVESVNICNNKESVCQTPQPALNGYIVEAKIKNLGLDRQFHTTTKILNSVGGELLVRSTKGDPEKIEVKSGESKWIALTDNKPFAKNPGESVNMKLEIRDFSGYKNIITGSYDAGSKKDFELPQKYNFTNYGISLIGSESNLIGSNAIIPLLSTDGSIYLESSSNNEISKNQIVSIGSGHGILMTDGSPASNNNRLKSNKITVIGKKSSALYIRGSQNITALSDILFSSNSSDISLERAKDIKLINVTFRKDKISLVQDNDVEVKNFLNILVKDAETGLPVNNVQLKVKNNKDKQEVLSEKVESGEKKAVEIVKKKIKSSKPLKAASLESANVYGPKISFSESLFLQEGQNVEEENLEYIATAEADGYKSGSVIISPNSPGTVEISLVKKEAVTEDPIDQVPPPPASSPPSSGTSYIITPESIRTLEKISETSFIRVVPESIKLSAVEDIITDINQVINIENTGNSPLKLNLKIEGFNQLSLEPSLELDSKEEKQINLVGKISDLKTGTYPGKILITSADSQINKELPIVLTVNPPKHLFDLVLDLSSESSAIFAGDEISINTKIVNVAGNRFDVKIKYGLKDLTNKILFEETQAISGDAITELIKKIKTDPGFESGNYIIEALLKDQADDNVAVSALTVYINGKVISRQRSIDLPMGLILSIIIVIVVTAFIVTKFVIKKK